MLLCIIALISLIPTLGCAIATTILWRRFHIPQDASLQNGLPSLSLIVPIKGADTNTREALHRLVTSTLPLPHEFVFAMEETTDPAFAICEDLQRTFPTHPIRIVITGPSGTRMGKQHNLAVAATTAQYSCLGSMDADVWVDSNAIISGLQALIRPGTGTSYALPYYVGNGPVGGRFVALYLNSYYNLYLGAWALATGGKAPFIMGGFWLMQRETVDRIGGLEQFTTRISDDRAIGRAVLKHHLRNILLPRTVSMPVEQLSHSQGLQHLGKWNAMLRAEGIVPFLVILWYFHPILWSMVGGLVIMLSFGLTAPITAWSMACIVGAFLIRLLSTIILNRKIYRQSWWQLVRYHLVYELWTVPIVFSRGLFLRSIEWKGRHYRLGRHGIIRSNENNL
jgi:ceramide glucosyltransferase